MQQSKWLIFRVWGLKLLKCVVGEKETVSFYHVGPGHGTQVSGSATSAFPHWVIWLCKLFIFMGALHLCPQEHVYPAPPPRGRGKDTCYYARLFVGVLGIQTRVCLAGPLSKEHPPSPLFLFHYLFIFIILNHLGLKPGLVVSAIPPLGHGGETIRRSTRSSSAM